MRHDESGDASSVGISSSDRFVRVMGFLSLGFAFVLVVWGSLDEIDRQLDPFRPILALGLLTLLGAVAAYAEVTDRLVMLADVGAISVVSGVLLGVVGLAVLSAGIFWIWSTADRGLRFKIDIRLALAATIWVVGILISLVSHQDPACTTLNVVGACSSNVVVWWELAAGLGLGGLAIAIIGSRPRAGMSPSTLNHP